ncbi:MAG: 6-bladed beta-propeller [Tannerella sp.]|jgi:hypothetical protein|nr:6-bladed beta-propeller [Tannerella sp.]
MAKKLKNAVESRDGNMPSSKSSPCAKPQLRFSSGKYPPLILWICLAFIFCRCREKDEILHLPVASYLNKVEEVPLEDFAASVKKVQLETSDSILIAEIYKVFQTDEFFIVMHLFRISVFDKEGKYLNDISRKGQGPHEFNGISSIFIKDSLFYLYDTSHKEVSVFTFGGEFVRSFSTGNYYNLIFPLQDDDYVAFQLNISGKEKKKLIFFDESKELNAIPYDREYAKPKNVLLIFEMEGHVYSHDGKDYFKEQYSDTLFTIQPGHTLEPRLIFDLGRYQPTLERKHALTDVNYGWDDMAHLSITGETDSYLFFNVRINRETHAYYWDKQRKSLHNVRFTYPRDYGYEGAFIPGAVSEDRRNLISIEEDTVGGNNPAIIIATLKK